jgi:hypothetical protein
VLLFVIVGLPMAETRPRHRPPASPPRVPVHLHGVLAHNLVKIAALAG